MKKVFAPFLILHYHKLYIIWIVSLFLGILDIFKYLIQKDFSNIFVSIQSGVLYTYSLSISIPFTFEILLSFFLDAYHHKESTFTVYKIGSSLFNIIWMIVLSLFWLAGDGQNTVLQIIFCIFSIIFSVYMYCVEKMDDFYCEFKIYDEDYAAISKDRMSKIRKKANDLSNNGEIDFGK